MGCQLGSTLPGKDSLAVAAHTHGPLYRYKVSEIPYLFSYEEGTFIILAVNPLIVLVLVFLTEHSRHHLMDARHCVGPVFRQHNRLFLFRPEIQFHVPSITGSIQVAAQVIPAVVAVQAYHVHGPGGDILCVVILTAHQRHRAVLGVLPVGQLIEGMPVVICLLGIVLQIRLISQAPHHHAGMVLVPLNQVLYNLLMVFPGAAGIGISISAHVQSHRSCLVNYHDSLTVAQVVHLLRIWVMAGAEGIGPQPVNQVHVLYIQTEVQSPPPEKRVLMFSESLEIKRLSVEQELFSLYLRSAQAKVLFIHIRSIFPCQGDAGSIQVGCSRPWFPQAWLPDGHGSFTSPGSGGHIPLPVKDLNFHISLSLCLYLIFHVSFQIRHQSNVFNELPGRGVEIHGSENTCIVEKVKVWAVLQLLLPLSLLHAWNARIVRTEKRCLCGVISGRQGGMVQPVIHCHGEKQAASRLCQIRYLCLKGQKSALMGTEQGIPQPHHGTVGHRAEPQPQSLPLKQNGHGKRPLIIGPPIMVPVFHYILLVIVAGRHRHRLPVS